MGVGKMDLIVRPYFAMALQEWERAISCKRACDLSLRGIKEYYC